MDPNLPASSSDPRWDDTQVRAILDRGPGLIEMIQATQRTFGYLPRPVLETVARSSDIPLAQVLGVATFYAGFHLNPRGKHIVKVCTGTACHVAAAERITDALSDKLGVGVGETTGDQLFTLETVACVGCCSLAPVVVMGEDIHGRQDRTTAVTLLEELELDGRELDGGKLDGGKLDGGEST